MSKLRVLLRLDDEVGGGLTSVLQQVLPNESFEIVERPEDAYLADLLVTRVDSLPPSDTVNRKKMNIFLLGVPQPATAEQIAEVKRFNDEWGYLVAAAVSSDPKNFGRRLGQVLETLVRGTLSQYKLMDVLTVHAQQLARQNITNPERLLNRYSGYSALARDEAEMQFSFDLSPGAMRLLGNQERGGNTFVRVSLASERGYTSKSMPNIVIVEHDVSIEEQVQIRAAMAKKILDSLNRLVYVFASPRAEGTLLLQEGLDLLNHRGGLLQWALSGNEPDVLSVANFSTPVIESLLPTAEEQFQRFSQP